MCLSPQTVHYEYDSEEDMDEESITVAARTLGKRFAKPTRTILSTARPNVVFSVTSTAMSIGASVTYPVLKVAPLPVKQEEVIGECRK